MASAIYCALLHWRLRRNDEEAMTNKPLSRSLTWAELAVQSSTEQASSAAEAAAWERVIGNARRGSLGGAENWELRFLSSLKKETVFLLLLLSRPLLLSFLGLVIYLSSSFAPAILRLRSAPLIFGDSSRFHCSNLAFSPLAMWGPGNRKNDLLTNPGFLCEGCY